MGVQADEVVAHLLDVGRAQVRAGDDVLDRHRLRLRQDLAALGLPGLDQRVGRGGARIGEPVLDEEGHGVLVARVGDVDLRRLDLRIAQRGTHHPRGDRIFVGRAELAALQLGQRGQRRIGRDEEARRVFLVALGDGDQLVAAALDRLDRHMGRVDHRQVVGLGSITSNGFLLLWADEDKSQGPMHMSFKLSSTSGENIYLSYFNGDQYRIIDSVSFGSMVANQSIGCLPDGTTPMVTQTPTSPGASNFTVGINEVENQFSETIYPNPATDHFRITLSSQSKGVAEIQLFDLSGKMISLQSNLHVEMGMNHFSLERPFSIASGMYRLRINMKQNDGSTIESNSKIVFE